MIAVDSNVLVYAHREDSPWHDAAYTRILQLAEGRAPWAIPWPCIHEFLAIVTHARIYAPPTPLETAADQVEAWMESPSLISFLNRRTTGSNSGASSRLLEYPAHKSMMQEWLPCAGSTQ